MSNSESLRARYLAAARSTNRNEGSKRVRGKEIGALYTTVEEAFNRRIPGNVDAPEFAFHSLDGGASIARIEQVVRSPGSERKSEIVSGYELHVYSVAHQQSYVGMWLPSKEKLVRQIPNHKPDFTLAQLRVLRNALVNGQPISYMEFIEKTPDVFSSRMSREASTAFNWW